MPYRDHAKEAFRGVLFACPLAFIEWGPAPNPRPVR